jgi:hypothetical protein
VLNGKTYLLDVLKNDYDSDGDDMTILPLTTTSQYGSYIARFQTCPMTTAATCSAVTCQNIDTNSTPCTCNWDLNRRRCFPSIGREYTISYTAPVARCGPDSFQYSISTNDGVSTATAVAKMTRCYCRAASRTANLHIAFVLDGVVDANSYAWQLSFVDALQRRTDGTTQYRFSVYTAGPDVITNTWTGATTPTYVDISTLALPAGAANAKYDLARSLVDMRTRLLSAIAAVTGNARVVVVILSSRESQTNIASAGATVRAAFPGRVELAFVSVNPSGKKYGTSSLLQPYYSSVATTFQEAAKSDAAQLMMDELCNLGF